PPRRYTEKGVESGTARRGLARDGTGRQSFDIDSRKSSRMASKRDYYEVLGLSRGAIVEEIDRAYRKLVMQYHPDRTGGDKDEEIKSKEVADAHEILRDPDKRARYDRYGHAGLQAGDVPDFSGDAFAQMFSDLFGSFFGGGRGRGHQQQTGRDM